MGDRITTLRDCPKCGGKDMLECYEALSSYLKFDQCLNRDCDYHVIYSLTEADGVMNITAIPSEQLASKQASPSAPLDIDPALDEALWDIMRQVGVNSDDEKLVTEAKMAIKAEFTRLLETVKTSIRGEGEPGHAGEMIAVNEVDEVIDDLIKELS